MGSPLWEFYLRWFAPTHRMKSAKERENTSIFFVDSQRSLTSSRAIPPSVHSASISLPLHAVKSGFEVGYIPAGTRYGGGQESSPLGGNLHASIRKRTINR